MSEKSNKNLVAMIVARSADEASVAWAHDGTGPLAALPDALSAIDAAAELGNVRALHGVTAPKELRKAAAAALHRLRSRGVRVEAPVAPRVFALPREIVDIPARAFLSVPDREGDIELLLSVSDDEGSCVLGVVVSGSAVVREAQHGHVSRSELREIWRKSAGREDFSEIPFASAVHFADLWLGASSAGRHHAWTHFLEHVSPATLIAARLLDPMRGAPTDEVGSAAMPWLIPSGLLDSAALERGVQRVSAFFATLTDAAPEGAPDAFATILGEVADAVVTEATRPALADAARLAATTFRFHRWQAAADALLAAADAFAAGRPGSTIEAVTNTVRLFALTAVTQRFQG